MAVLKRVLLFLVVAFVLVISLQLVLGSRSWLAFIIGVVVFVGTITLLLRRRRRLGTTPAT